MGDESLEELLAPLSIDFKDHAALLLMSVQMGIERAEKAGKRKGSPVIYGDLDSITGDLLSLCMALAAEVGRLTLRVEELENE